MNTNIKERQRWETGKKVTPDVKASLHSLRDFSGSYNFSRIDESAVISISSEGL